MFDRNVLEVRQENEAMLCAPRGRGLCYILCGRQRKIIGGWPAGIKKIAPRDNINMNLYESLYLCMPLSERDARP